VRELRLRRRDESDCERIRRLASIQLDGELSELGIRRLNRHLNHCAPCGDFAASLTATTNALRRGSCFTAPPRAGREPAVAKPGIRRSLVRLDLTPPA
jgi:predicted anti-sigma-YlaC factor YlaD